MSRPASAMHRAANVAAPHIQRSSDARRWDLDGVKENNPRHAAVQARYLNSLKQMTAVGAQTRNQIERARYASTTPAEFEQTLAAILAAYDRELGAIADLGPENHTCAKRDIPVRK